MRCEKTQKRFNRSQWMLNQSVNRVVTRLSIPMFPAIIGIIAVDLFDAYLASRLGTESLAALSFTIPVTSVLFALSIGLTIGTTSVLSFLLGKGKHHKAQKLVTNSLLLAIFVSILVALIGLFTIRPLFEFLGVNYALIPESFHQGPRPDLMPLITSYMQFRYVGFVFMMLPLLLNGVMRATGDTQLAGSMMLLWALVTAGLNSYLMVFSDGTVTIVELAVGHLISGMILSMINFLVVFKREKLINFSSINRLNFMSNSRSVLAIGLPAISISMLTPVAIALVTSWVAYYGREAVAAFGVISRLETLALFFPMVLSTSLPIFVGQNVGAGQVQRALDAIKHCLKLSLILQIIVYFVIYLSAEFIAASFSGSLQVTELIEKVLWILPASYAGQAVVILMVSALNAMHRPKEALALSVIRMFGLLVPGAYFGAYLASLEGLFWGLFVANCCIGIVAYGWLIRLNSSVTRLSYSHA